MARVLVVDDEPSLRDHLGLYLSGLGYEVTTAASGREAIDLGSRFRPDVLVVDWMLTGRIHGLHVSDVLQAVDQELKTILITGFASPDLKAEAKKRHVFDFIEKPFDPNRLELALRDALEAEAPSGVQVAIPVVEVDAAGVLTYANPQGRELLAQTLAGKDAANLADLLGLGSVSDLDTASQQWMVVSPPAPQPISWHIRSKKLADARRLVVLVDSDDRQGLRDIQAVQMLLADAGPEHPRWPFPDRALVVDGTELVRRIAVAQLEQSGCICHGADTHGLALELAKRDPGIGFVILEYDMQGDLARFVRKLKDIRPDVTIVGNSDEYRRDYFTAVGVERFITKPWRIADLIDLLTGRIRECVTCSLPIPLRRPQAGEVGSSWECCGCGGRYFAVLDEDSDPDILGNVRPADNATPRA